MSDKDIKKALEDCIKHNEECARCPSFDFCEKNGAENIMKFVLDLINRLEAENEQLKREIEDLESMQEISPEAKHFVDTKADKVISLLNEVIKSQEQIKAEAYKELVKLLKSIPRVYVYKNEIDNALKELVGDSDG